MLGSLGLAFPAALDLAGLRVVACFSGSEEGLFVKMKALWILSSVGLLLMRQGISQNLVVIVFHLFIRRIFSQEVPHQPHPLLLPSLGEQLVGSAGFHFSAAPAHTNPLHNHGRKT